MGGERVSEPLLSQVEQEGGTGEDDEVKAANRSASGDAAANACCYAVLFTQWLLMTTIPAFFPTASVTRDISRVMQGLIFSAFPFGSALVSPFIGKVIGGS